MLTITNGLSQKSNFIMPANNYLEHKHSCWVAQCTSRDEGKIRVTIQLTSNLPDSGVKSAHIGVPTTNRGVAP